MPALAIPSAEKQFVPLQGPAAVSSLPRLLLMYFPVGFSFGLGLVSCSGTVRRILPAFLPRAAKP